MSRSPRLRSALLAVTVPAVLTSGGLAWAGVVPAVALLPSCGGLPVTIDAEALGLLQPIVGTDGPDVILGTAGDDSIYGGGGDDVVCGAGGDDRLLGEDGDDLLDGGDGADVLKGGPGDDTLSGGPGDDALGGSGGADSIRGDDGEDRLVGGSGDDSLWGGDGADRLYGVRGADRLDGGAGTDLLSGGPHDDVLRGGDDDDQLEGGNGNDVLIGGGGDDLLIGGYGPDTLVGGGGADLLNGGVGGDLLNGGDGNDTLRGGNGSDLMKGGPGDDTMNGGNGGDALGGGPGSDVLRGGEGGDVLHGGPGGDDLFGGGGSDLLFRSEYPSRDRMDGGADEDVVDAGARGTEAAGVRRYLTEAEALSFRGSYLLSEFTTYHNCCENRVVNIQTMADAVHGHMVMPGEAFSVNDTVGRRTAAKGYLPAGAIIGGYVQCCDHPANMGGGTSQFGTTIYNAIFFAGLEDIQHQPHSLDFARYPDGREATMGYPRPDVAFRNDTSHPVLITTHHAGYRGTSITVKFWGDNGGRVVTAGASPRRDYYSTSRVVYEGDASLTPGQVVVKTAAQPGFTIDVFRYIDYPDGTRTTEKWTWTYSAGPEVRKVHPCELPPDSPDYTGEACPGDGDGDGGGQIPA